MLASISDGTHLAKGMLTEDSIINNIIINNNNNILLYNLYYDIMLTKLKTAKLESDQAMTNLETEYAQISDSILSLELKFKNASVLTEVKNIELTSTGGFDFKKYEGLFFKLKQKDSSSGMQDVMKYLSLQRNKKKISMEMDKITSNVQPIVPQEVKGGRD